jgi:hypothetical protein
MKEEQTMKIEQVKYKAIIEIRQTKKEFKEIYTLKARIGIRIACLLGIVYLELTD